VIAGGSHCDDLRAAAATDPEAVRSAKLEVVGQLEEWLKEWNCTGQCGEHGRCVVNSCVCEDEWGGKGCDSQTPSKTSYDNALNCAIIIPIVMAVVLIVIAALLFRSKKADTAQPLLPN
jgi:hypothetical protein